MRLRKHEKCPIHHSWFCCGRESHAIKKDRGFSTGAVRRVEDSHHPRGYRELCSKAEMRRRLAKKLELQDGICAWCHLPIDDFREASIDHREPRGMGAANRDDHVDNIFACHHGCNSDKGSRRVTVNSAGLYLVKSKESA